VGNLRSRDTRITDDDQAEVGGEFVRIPILFGKTCPDTVLRLTGP
jgi:hypothetical protein